MNAHISISSLVVKFVHILVVLAIALSSAFSAVGVQRAAAKAQSPGNSSMGVSALLSQIIPLTYLCQVMVDRIKQFLDIDPAESSWQEVEATPADDPRITPTPTVDRDISPTPSPSAIVTPDLQPTAAITPTVTLTPTATLTPSETIEPTPTAGPCSDETCYTPTPPSPTPSASPTMEEEPTATDTPTFTLVPSETPQVTQSSLPCTGDTCYTSTPSSTPTVTETPQLTATETITTTPTIPAGIAGLAQLRLGGLAEWIAAGYPFTLTWGIEGLPALPLGLVLVLTLPEGFTPLGVPEGSWDPLSCTLTLSLSALSGWTGIDVSPDAVGPFTFHAELYWHQQFLIEHDFTLPQEWLTQLGVEGGIARGLSDQVGVYFPAGALYKTARVHIRAPKDDALPYSLSEAPFEITAIGEDDGQEIHEFTKPITITMSYSDMQINGDESMLTLFYYDEQASTWIPLLSQVDLDAKILTGWSDHLSFFDGSVQDWEAARLPNLKNFQVSSFTGAATYSFPIEVPPGPGGLQPSVSLNYNSQTVDGASGTTQAEWVGMGWSLDTGYIQRNMNGTPNGEGDDLFTINANGVGGLMLKDEDGYYHTEDETFWRIQWDKNNDIWYAWDKSGMEYIFGEMIVTQYDHRARYPQFYTDPQDPCYIEDLTWKWVLTKVRNTNEKELTYLYSKTTNYDSYFLPDECEDPQSYAFDAAMYPTEIRYPNNRYRVVFSQSDVRTDYDTAWDDDDSRVFYQKTRLDWISIEYNPDGDADFAGTELVRRYALTYASGSGHVFPNYTWSAGGKNLTLVQIQEYGRDGGYLPPTNFTYGYGMHLTQATNGYGGKINYTYESWNELYTQDGKTLYQNFDTICPASEGSWQEYPVDDYNDVDCKVRDAKNVLYIKGAAKRTLDLGLFHPAGVYEIKLQGVTGENGNVAYLGLNDGVNDSYLPVGGFPCAGYFAHPFEFSSNGDARRKPFSEIYSNLSKID